MLSVRKAMRMAHAHGDADSDYLARRNRSGKCSVSVRQRTDVFSHLAQPEEVKSFVDTRTKRNTAFAMLLVWLFAMASGVANACFLQSPEAHPTSKVSAAITSHAHDGLLSHSGTAADHHEVSDSSKESCLKACDEGAHTLLKAQSGVDHADPGPAPVIATLWTGSLQVVSVPRRMDDLAVPIVGPPLRVRYSRLVL